MIKDLLRRFRSDDSGQDLIEYAFLAVFIGLAVTTALSAVGSAIDVQFARIGERTTGS